LDEKEIVKQILSSYNEITVTEVVDNIVFFMLKGKEYGFSYTMKQEEIGSPYILVKNENKYNYPHILPFDVPADMEKKDKYRFICLYENENVIRYLQTYEEKIIDTVERLIELLSLTDLEIEREFQKEFLLYWNSMAKNQSLAELYLSRDRVFKQLNAYQYNKVKMRIVDNAIRLTDLKNQKDGEKEWNHKPELPCFYIPIIDNRRILPPTKDQPWDETNILMIVNAREYCRISHQCYELMAKAKVKSSSIGLVFEMIVQGTSINFTTIVHFKSAKNDTLLNKLKNEILSVEIIRSKRVDYYHLSRQIGNDTSLIGKRVLLIGAGSLGSYVAKELVKAGVCNLTIYDSDILEHENILRHNAYKICVNLYKVDALKYDLEWIHPEIHVCGVSREIDKNLLKEEMLKNDIIIFTVGSSDVQLECNRVFFQENFSKPVIYTWLEAGGEASHILIVNYSRDGCFECLYTDENGGLVNNRANSPLADELIKSRTIKNGCGATRVAYGTAILLRTTSVLLDTLPKVFDETIKQNSLIDISPTGIVDQGNSFAERNCQYCGDRNRE